MVAKEEGRWGRDDEKFGISRSKLLYIEWINSKVLLDSTGNCIQNPIIHHNGKNMSIYTYN